MEATPLTTASAASAEPVRSSERVGEDARDERRRAPRGSTRRDRRNGDGDRGRVSPLARAGISFVVSRVGILLRRIRSRHHKRYTELAVAILLLYACVVFRREHHSRTTKVFHGPVVTFSRIGQEGRLGNQLFQIAATIGLAEAHGYSWGFYNNLDRCAAGRLFKLHGNLNIHRVIDFKEHHQVFYNVTLPKVRKNNVISLSGYFQDYRYFNASLNTLDTYLRLPHELVSLVQSKVPEVRSKFSVALHVRRGDYTKLNELYNVLDSNYYLRALSLIEGRIDHVIIVSDDVSWCEENLASKIAHRVVFSPFKDDLFDFVLLHLSEILVIANSSFSWWAAFLKHVRSTNKTNDASIRVFAPALWYNASGSLAHMNRDSFLPPTWIRVAI
ncbi:glycosyl transferase family 11-domain-containing protein [Ostreococcus tauri]|uniref:Glycosyl transferase family 11-domain-containing protein n=1 Tax=Ostreococcus tauri TaxID=70448 RepID=A0A1Y5HWN5_OSTTA|nr:glycosyl transferase family 11-domain-containing protein [Ostreococcus tauri]